MQQMPLDHPVGPSLRPGPGKLGISALIDVIAIVLFVILGRSSHHENGSFVVSTLKVAAPFLIALAVGWLVARAWKSPDAPSTGFIVWGTTIVLGMVLRHFAFHRGTALPFIIVATLFTGLFLVGWRVVADWLRTRRASST
jgi:hypothetical protein